MKIEVLSSGSKGNTTYIETDKSKILIDAGNSAKYIISKLESIGVSTDKLDAILLTHTHCDHINGLKVLQKKTSAIIYMTEPMHDNLDYIINYKFIEEGRITINDLVIDVISTSHDAKGSVGYVLSNNGKSLVYITDTGYINKKYFDLLENKDVYIMESNHDVELLNNGPYPFELRQRILSDKGHLSNYDSAKYLTKFIGVKTKYIFLAHLSEENNTKELALNTLKDRLVKENKSVNNIIVTEQNKETELIMI